LIVTPSLRAAITHLEADIVYRARLMETTDQPTMSDLRHADPGEPLPATIIIATAPKDENGALRAILQLGAAYSVGGLLLGQWPIGTTLHLDAHAIVTHAEGPQAHIWNNAHLFQLPPADAAPMLQLIRAASGAPGIDRTSTESSTETNDDRVDAVRLATDKPASSVPGPETHVPDDGELRPVILHVLGPVRLEAAGEPITTGLRRIARDLLVYLALNPRGCTLEQGIDALMPERDLDTGTTMFHTAINNVRKTLRAAVGTREPMFIIHAFGRYHLDPTIIDVDLWQFQTALHKAQHATTDNDRIEALQAIPDLYLGELAEGLYYTWVETERENLRRRATDALTYLARLKQNDQPDQALAILEKAIDHDPYAEALYQELMRLQIRLDRSDSANRTYQLLTNRLADLDTQPTNESQQLHQTARSKARGVSA
jgi:DNA-binding SARP family transcriptional activator